MANLDNFVRDNPVLHDVWVEMTEKGEIKGARETIRRVLEGRFGPLNEEILAALQAADLPRLEHIADHAALDTPEQIRLRLGLPTS